MYEFLTVSEVKKALPRIIEQKVSQRARLPDGFTSVYINEGKKGLAKQYPTKNHSYFQEREYFIKRHLAEYIKNPSERRKLALQAWAYQPS